MLEQMQFKRNKRKERRRNGELRKEGVEKEMSRGGKVERKKKRGG